MADKRITDFTEAALAGADYYLVTDSASDGVKKIKPANIVPAFTGDVTKTAGGTVTTIAANAVTNAKAAQMAAGTIKANLTGALASASDNTINAVMDAAFGSVQGAVAYRGASGWASLAPGTSGQFMQTSGPSANPIWQTIPGGGNMLSSTYDPASVASNAFDGYPVVSRTALKALDTSKFSSAYLLEAGREGQFVWKTGDYSASVTADTLEGIYLKANTVATTAGAWVRVDFLERKLVNPVWFGAKLDGVADDGPATVAAIAMVPHVDGAEFVIPFGILRTSQTLVFNNIRATFNCIGRIMPFGAFSDYLVYFVFDGGVIVDVNVAYRPNITRLDLDCEWKCRGVRFYQPYLSMFPKIYITRAYGTALEIDGGFECLFTNTVLTLGKNRDAPWFATVAGWSAATAYNVGDHVFEKYPDWTVGTAYAVDAVVTRSGRAYRSVVSANVGNDPATVTNNSLWASINYEYYECLIAHTNKEPHLGFTANNDLPANRYWKMVPAHDPLLKIDNSQAANMLIDNMHFSGLMIRDSDSKIAVWVDSNANEKRTININFSQSQIHCMTPGIQASILAVYGSTVLFDDGPDRRMVYFGRVDRSNFVQSYIRVGQYTDGTAFQIGAVDPGKNGSSIGAELLELSGEGSRQIGIHVMPGVTTGLAFYLGQIQNFISGTGSVLFTDPGLRLSGRMATPQLFPAGNSFRPAIAWSDDPTFGWIKNGASTELWQNGTSIVGFGNVGGVAQANLPAKTILAPLPSAADDVNAATAGVPVGGLYRNGNAVWQRVT